MTSPILLRRLVVLSPPVALALLEVWHPVSFGEIPAQVTWWLVLHLLQLPLFGLLALSVLTIAGGESGKAVTVTRIGMGLFLVFYIAFDSIAGIATGLLVSDALSLPPSEQSVVLSAAESLATVQSGFLLALTAIGTLGWILGVAGATAALARERAPPSAVLFLAMGAAVFAFGHVPPFGPVGLGLFSVGCAIEEFGRRRS